jgi:ubiquinone/menaquinone biosynthesis C-methylase UbiE
MTETSISFSGTIPENYDEHLGTLFFEPYAKDLAARIGREHPASILEIACGTGRLTQYLSAAAPAAKITATDINAAMLEVAKKKVKDANITFSVADSGALPFDDGSYALVTAQYGVMFYPDKPKAFREAYRVLAPGGVFVFNTWDSMKNNPIMEIAQAVIEKFFPVDTPAFYSIPFSYYHEDVIMSDLRQGGFSDITIENVLYHGYSPSPRSAALGLVKGNPIYTAIMDKEPGELDVIISEMEGRFKERFGKKDLSLPLSAFVVTCRK